MALWLTQKQKKLQIFLYLIHGISTDLVARNCLKLCGNSCEFNASWFFIEFWDVFRIHFCSCTICIRFIFTNSFHNSIAKFQEEIHSTSQKFWDSWKIPTLLHSMEKILKNYSFSIQIGWKITKIRGGSKMQNFLKCLVF